MTPAARLRHLLARPGLLQAPGCFDALSARLVERGGFRAAYLTGFGVAASAFGVPDLGLVSFGEMVGRAAAVASATSLPLIADADTGFGNALNAYRTVREYARAGLAAVQLEDQVAPKRCGHTEGKEVVPLGEMVEKLRAACDARAEADIVIVARTDARAVLGFEAALERCRAFADAGADVVFCEAPQTEEELARVPREVPAPCLVNLVEGGRTPLLPAQRLEALGYRLAIYPVTLLYAAVAGMGARLGGGTLQPWEGPSSFEDLKGLVGFPEWGARAASYRG
ncbi:MAG: isocitrate lyase/PEP mutase family protein [Thermodesulfobacteriota bacterium]